MHSTATTLTPAQEIALARLHNHRTRHEIEVARADGTKALVSYTPRKGQRGLLAAVFDSRERLIAFLGEATTGLVWDRQLSGFRFSTAQGPATIRFTGRTQREAIMAGCLPSLAA